MDTETALAAATLMLLTNGGVLSLMLRHFSAQLHKAAISWQIGTLSIAIGCLVFIMARQLPLVVASTLANGLIMIGLTAYWQALRQFYGYPNSRLLWVPVITGTLSILWFSSIEPDAKIRIMIVSAVWLMLMGGSAKTLMVQAAKDTTLSRQVLMSLFIGMLLFTAFRAAYYSQIDMGSAFNVMDNSNWMNLATAMVEVALPVVGTTVFVLMCSERTRQQSKKNQRKAEALSYISHDLRAPLATIVGYTQLLSNSGIPEQANHIRAIERSANYQLTLIDEILEYAKHELKPLNIQLEPTSLPTLLNNIIQQADCLSHQQKNQFEFEADTPLPVSVLTDSLRLQQVLLNLISNAAKFTRDGQIQLTVSATTINNTNSLAFTVTDTGIGIDPKTHASIFKAFEQIDERPNSTGLGLYIAQRIVEGLGGELQLKSSLGMGSCFSFNIPAESIGTETTRMPSYRSIHAVIPTSSTDLSTRTPPKDICIDLAKFAHNGQLSDIEGWLQQHSLKHSDHDKFFNEIREALQILDFERIKSIALEGEKL